ncbi:type-2 angiotensin II receptor [Alosa alosa]|uniref:type-2 angiotensin II receptor n=1 Tax=Alosa sapidissima TaxID=34773 RepID=UPI001C09AD39|nr:type-2 angiotensin II receptor [Alosa sapidissima]XP_041949863.1 type-2 angiotensin II receptor [Alosa sapidissima]XP_048087661.1 type-2 angiotensin II receptor [Alosa alosa]XP_048087670.1 type-2 angiotensin II receptor [Alosa alosa]XP_048087679.1 type-2 angiotensin II receptor [Alosa alosa]
MDTENGQNISVPEASCDSFSPSLHQKGLVPAMYSVIFVLGFLGNVLVVCVLCRRSCRQTVANTYLVNLAMSDLLFLSGLPFWAVYYSLDYTWVFGWVMCKVCGGLLSLNVYASIFFITCMSVDRYRAIVHPFRSQSSRSVCRARAVSVAIWAIAALSTVPNIWFRQLHPLAALNVTGCVMAYPSAEWYPAQALAKNTLGFLLPLTVIVTCYYRIGRHLLNTPSIEQGPEHLDRVLRMVVAVVLAFFLCWFPFHVLTFLSALASLGVHMPCWVEKAVEALMSFSLCLGFSNSAINPFLYCFVGNHFREQLWRLYKEKAPRLSQKRDSISTRLSSFSRKLSDLRDPGFPDTANLRLASSSTS